MCGVTRRDSFVIVMLGTRASSNLSPVSPSPGKISRVLPVWDLSGLLKSSKQNPYLKATQYIPAQTAALRSCPPTEHQPRKAIINVCLQSTTHRVYSEVRNYLAVAPA